MILISNGKDCYDHIIHQRGRDNKIVFKRTFGETPDPAFSYEIQPNWNAIIQPNSQSRAFDDRLMGNVVGGWIYPWVLLSKDETPVRAVYNESVKIPKRCKNLDLQGELQPVYSRELHEYQIKNMVPYMTVQIHVHCTLFREYITYKVVPADTVSMTNSVVPVVDLESLVDTIYNTISAGMNIDAPDIKDNTVKLESHGFDKRVAFRHRK